MTDFVGWFEDAYFLFSVRLFDASLSRVNANPKKIYCVDHALVSLVSSGILVTRSEEACIDVPGGSVEVVPAWRFLLKLPERENETRR